MKKPVLNPEDAELFRQAVGEVKPIVDDRAERYKELPSDAPKQLHLDEQQAIKDMLSDHYDPNELNEADAVQFHRPGLQHSVLRKLKRGQYSISDELDLHGMTKAEARQALLPFIAQARLHGKNCVRIIHGKGHGSSNKGPVLKPMVAKWLMQLDDVLAYCSARPEDGGSGAVYVLLKK